MTEPDDDDPGRTALLGVALIMLAAAIATIALTVRL